MLPRIAMAVGLLVALILPQELRAAETVRPYQLAQASPFSPQDYELLLKRKKRQKQLPYGRQQAEPLPGGQQQGFQQLIPESMAVGVAMQILPDSKPLGVRLLSGDRPVYAVKVRSQGQVQRVLVDALTGEVIGQ
jgi:uncharacterized membrane protein YkoI